jgi:DNA-binding NtrC family response regulator
VARSVGEGEEGRNPGVPHRILIIEDEELIREVLLTLLREAGYRVDTVGSGEEGLRALESRLYDLVLLDLNLPGMHGLNVLSAAPVLQTDAQFIVMTAFGSVDTAVEAMKLGAYDYINKPFRSEELLLSVTRALEETALRREVAQLRRSIPTGTLSRLVGRTPPMQRLFDVMERVAPTRATVLVTGETGTGKELVARGIHELSDRVRRPFVAVNCSALPESLLESELFGHVKGAFTGAVQSRRGLFEEAQGGTLFLDEISTISQTIQVKLLRVLQERTIQRVGGREPVPVDFRLIAATNQELEEEVRKGTFREDLFYRLNVFPIRVPPLRERPEDIPLLAAHFLQRFADENGLQAPGLTPETIGRMMAWEWPGNVRELENFIERGVIMHAGARSLPFDAPGASSASPSSDLRPDRILLARAREEGWNLERLEREYILQVLEDTRWHQGQAASLLGVNRRTLYRKLRQYREEGVLPDGHDPGDEEP